MNARGRSASARPSAPRSATSCSSSSPKRRPSRCSAASSARCSAVLPAPARVRCSSPSSPAAQVTSHGCRSSPSHWDSRSWSACSSARIRRSAHRAFRRSTVCAMSKIREFITEALEILWGNRMRSLLTMLGLIIGVGSVITTLAVGDSMNRSVKNLLSPFSQAASFVSAKESQPDPQVAAIRYEDAQRIAPHVAGATAVYPVVEIVTTTEVRHTQRTLVVDTDGAGVGFDQTPLAEGRRFTPDDVSAHRRVAILSDQAKQELYPDQASVSGRSVRLAGTYYTIV